MEMWRAGDIVLVGYVGRMLLLSHCCVGCAVGCWRGSPRRQAEDLPSRFGDEVCRDRCLGGCTWVLDIRRGRTLIWLLLLPITRIASAYIGTCTCSVEVHVGRTECGEPCYVTASALISDWQEITEANGRLHVGRALIVEPSDLASHETGPSTSPPPSNSIEPPICINGLLILSLAESPPERRTYSEHDEQDCCTIGHPPAANCCLLCCPSDAGTIQLWVHIGTRTRNRTGTGVYGG